MEVVASRRLGTLNTSAAASGSGAAALAGPGMTYDERRQQLKQQDMAGHIRMDRQNLKLAELQILFKVRPAGFLLLPGHCIPDPEEC